MCTWLCLHTCARMRVIGLGGGIARALPGENTALQPPPQPPHPTSQHREPYKIHTPLKEPPINPLSPPTLVLGSLSCCHTRVPTSAITSLWGGGGDPLNQPLPHKAPQSWIHPQTAHTYPNRNMQPPPPQNQKPHQAHTECAPTPPKKRGQQPLSVAGFGPGGTARGWGLTEGCRQGKGGGKGVATQS